MASPARQSETDRALRVGEKRLQPVDQAQPAVLGTDAIGDLAPALEGSLGLGLGLEIGEQRIPPHDHLPSSTGHSTQLTDE